MERWETSCLSTYSCFSLPRSHKGFSPCEPFYEAAAKANQWFDKAGSKEWDFLTIVTQHKAELVSLEECSAERVPRFRSSRSRKTPKAARIPVAQTKRITLPFFWFHLRVPLNPAGRPLGCLNMQRTSSRAPAVPAAWKCAFPHLRS